MTLTEAIKHCEDVADYDCFTDNQRKCSEEHRQLADWLRDYKRLLEESERKKGKWIGKEQYANSPEYYSWQCSVCGIVLEDPTLDKPYPFCPICGSYNGGEEE